MTAVEETLPVSSDGAETGPNPMPGRAWSTDATLSEEETAWINTSNEVSAQQARTYYAEAQAQVPGSVEAFWSLVFERRALAAGADYDPLGAWDAFELDPLADRTIIGIYGDGETGKSTDVLKTFARANLPRPKAQGGGIFSRGAIIITSASSVVAPYAGWLAKYPQAAKERENLTPEKIRWWNIPEKQPDGKTPYSASVALTGYIRRINEAQARGRMDYGVLILDEATALLDRVYSEFEAVSNNPMDPRFKGKKVVEGWPNGIPDGFSVFGAVNTFLREILSLGRARGTLAPMRLVLVGHPRPTGDGYLGMMKMPSRNAGQLLFNESDFFLRLYKEPETTVAQSVGLPGTAPSEKALQAIESIAFSSAPKAEGGKRRIQTSADAAWAAKVRAYEGARAIEDTNLEAVLEKAGVLLP